MMIAGKCGMNVNWKISAQDVCLMDDAVPLPIGTIFTYYYSLCVTIIFHTGIYLWRIF